MGQSRFSRLRSSQLASVLILVAALMSWVGSKAFGQNVNAGEIRGTVTDSSGAVMPGVTVSLLNTDTGVAK